MTDATKDTVYSIIERFGFPTLVALALGWFLRADVLLPLVEEHKTFVRNLSQTQQEISKAITEQTRLLYAMQPREPKYTTGGIVPDDGRN